MLYVYVELTLFLFYRKTEYFKKFRRRVRITALSSRSLMVLNEFDAATEGEEESAYTEYREELLEYDVTL